METEKDAYLAGIIDGEGSFIIIARKAKQCISYKPSIEINNTSKELIDWIDNNYEGMSLPNPILKDRCKPIWTWVANHQHVIPIIDKVFPYLVIKKEQALLVKELAMSVNPKRDTNGRFAIPSKKVLSRRAYLRLKLRELNKRGV